MNFTNYLFVYGTLLSGYDDKTSHKYLEKYTDLLGNATMRGTMYMVDYYPGVVISETKSTVKGELYKINDEKSLFGFLDKYEEYHEEDAEKSEYIRRKTEVTLNGEKIQSWVYIYNRDVADLEHLPKGDFLNEYHK